MDKGLYGPDLRDAIDVLADVLPAHLAATVSNDLWREQRCYVPAVVHQTAFDCSTSRPRLRILTPSKSRKRVLLLRTSDFDALFENVASAMSTAIDELVV